MSDSKKPIIQPMKDGPYLVSGLEKLANAKGPVETGDKYALCRCGGSENKPFCDGTHGKINFSSEKLPGRVEDKRDNYPGKDITVHDNRGICAHAGYCTDGLPSAFRLKEEPFVDPDGAPAEDVARQTRMCPSGALSHSIDDEEHRDQERDPQIFIAPHGPYVVQGGPELRDTERGEGASTEHWTMCRCGGSKNKPFCDGTHWYNKFQDDKNA